MKNVEQIINEAIDYELLAHEIYGIFKESFPKDSAFWEQLAEEELGHAALLRKTKTLHPDNGDILNIVSIDDIELLKSIRKSTEVLKEDFLKGPDKKLAYDIAIKIEGSKIESNYQKFMKKITIGSYSEVFQILNGDEMDHMKRIKEYFKS